MRASFLDRRVRAGRESVAPKAPRCYSISSCTKDRCVRGGRKVYRLEGTSVASLSSNVDWTRRGCCPAARITVRACFSVGGEEWRRRFSLVKSLSVLIVCVGAKDKPLFFRRNRCRYVSVPRQTAFLRQNRRDLFVLSGNPPCTPALFRGPRKCRHMLEEVTSCCIHRFALEPIEARRGSASCSVIVHVHLLRTCLLGRPLIGSGWDLLRGTRWAATVLVLLLWTVRISLSAVLVAL